MKNKKPTLTKRLLAINQEYKILPVVLIALFAVVIVLILQRKDQITQSDSSKAASLNFITRSGSNLYDGSQRFRFAGGNIYWLGLDENVGGINYPTKYRVDDALETAKEMGATVVRSHTLGANVGNSKSYEPSLGQFNESALNMADYSISKAGSLGIRLIIPLTDNWCYFHGGRWIFTNWRGLTTPGNCTDPNGDKFFTDATVRQDFKNYVSRLLNHVNSVTGIAYKDDPTIMSWELGNELMGTGITDDSPMLVDWSKSIADHIKSIDQKHLITYGYAYSYHSASALALSNVDMYSSHYYNNTETNRTANAATSAGKVFFVGEYSPTEDLSTYLPGFEQNNNISGTLYWHLMPHKDTGGYVGHGDSHTMHYTGDNATMKTKAQQLRNHAYAMSGQPKPPHRIPAAPNMFNPTFSSNGASIGWQGSVAAATYTIEKSTDGGSSWRTVASGLTDYNSPWLDSSGNSSAKYRIRGVNLDGVVGPFTGQTTTQPTPVNVTPTPQITPSPTAVPAPTRTATPNPTAVRTSTPTPTTTPVSTPPIGGVPGGLSPYGGTPVSLPGRIEAENFDEGGQNVAYYDATPGNSSGDTSYRISDVDIESFSDHRNIGYISQGEYVKYSVNVTQSGAYQFQFRVASPLTGGKMSIAVDGVPAETISVPNTGAWQSYTTVGTETVDLTQGQHVVTINMTEAGTAFLQSSAVGNIDYVDVVLASRAPQPPTTPTASPTPTRTASPTPTKTPTPTVLKTASPVPTRAPSTPIPTSVPVEPTPTPTAIPLPTPIGLSPYHGVAATIPGRIEAENFDEGGQNVAYYDATPGNSSGDTSYRVSDVDIESSSALRNVGYISKGEYLKYTVNVLESGSYTFRLRIGSKLTGGQMNVSVDNLSTGNLLVPNTGSWQAYTTVDSAPLFLTAGQHILTINMVEVGTAFLQGSAVGNIDYVDAVMGTRSPTETTPTPTTPSTTSGSRIRISAAGQAAEGIFPTMRLSINENGSWNNVATFSNINGDANAGQYKIYEYMHPRRIDFSQLQVQFINDKKTKNEDRNLRIGRIEINGVGMSPADPAVYSVGSWTPDTGCKGGYKQSEWLLCNGYFQVGR